MSTDKQQLILLSLLVTSFFQPTCTPSTFIRPNPPSVPTSKHDSAVVAGKQDAVQQKHEIDFAEAFDNADTTAGSQPDSVRLPITPQVENVPVASLRFPLFPVSTKMVRVALAQNVNKSVAYSVGTVILSNKQLRQPRRFRGRVLFEIKPGGRTITVAAGSNTFQVTPPCTLLSDNEYNFIEIGDTTYRGALIIADGKPGTFTVVNYLEVEEYLRGVVPLELGKRSREELEALKAQAVAARTYTYRQMLEHAAESFDVVNSVADQVYGGAAVEYRESDKAVKSTGNLIMVSGNSIILAYYHSTCGGTTADVSEAWGKPSCCYLRPVSDLDGSGKAYCRNSSYFTWEETWPWKQFSNIVMESLQKMFPQTLFKGVVTAITVKERYGCGRVKSALITGSGWAQDCGGDQIRYILLRGTSGRPILRSSSFTVNSPNRNTIRLSGKGYGHGVGMCQMGAVGRAQAGQNFATILKSYYSGVAIVTATVDK